MQHSIYIRLTYFQKITYIIQLLSLRHQNRCLSFSDRHAIYTEFAVRSKLQAVMDFNFSGTSPDN
jgi:hypothetical protein